MARALGLTVAVVPERTGPSRGVASQLQAAHQTGGRSVRALWRASTGKISPKCGITLAAESYPLVAGRGGGGRQTGQRPCARSGRWRHHAAKDILRAADLPLLGPTDSEVAADLKKVKLGDRLSPVLLVQGEPLWVADGYHRICASYHLDEKTEVPCRIVARGH